MVDFIRFKESNRQVSSLLVIFEKGTEYHIDGVYIRVYEPKCAFEDFLFV